MRKIIYNRSIEKLNEDAFLLFKKTADSLLEEREKIIIGIAGGRSVLGLYSLFKKKYSSLQWGRIHIFMSDERIVPPESNFSNFRQAKETFIDCLLRKNVIRRDNIHPFIMDKDADDYGTDRYTEEFKEAGGIFNIIILGTGEDGHTAALFPTHSSFHNESEFFTFFEDSPKPPPKRMTASVKLLQKTDTAFLFFLGQGKKNAYKNYLDKNTDIRNCPSKLVNNIRNAYIFTDISYPS
jgi:6-phosphogluconolactonase